LITFEQIEKAVAEANLGFHLVRDYHGNFGMSNHMHPLSILPAEAKVIHEEIIRINAKRGYEIATAFGVSTAVIGHALKQNGGKLVSMDAYIEEHVNNCSNYDVNTRQSFENADGYRCARALLQNFGLDNVTLEVGWSPTDVPRALDGQRLDLVFIDGGHTQEQITLDTQSVIPYLNPEKHIIFYHDSHCNGPDIHEFWSSKGYKHNVYGTVYNLISYEKV
jgi:predicted O-methyltransferase YrrM